VKEEDNPSKRIEHEDTLKSSLDELEEHLAATNEPFLGGLWCIDDLT